MSISKKEELSSEKLNEMKNSAFNILSQARQSILCNQPFTGAVAMKLEFVPVRDVRVRTASTDGRHIFFDLAFMSDLSKDEIKMVVAHEVWHNVMLHFTRKQNRDRYLFNLATDMEVNNILKEEQLLLPSMAQYKNLILSENFNFQAGKSAEDYYELILKEAKKSSKSSKKNKKQSNSSGNSGMPDEFDKHIYEGDDKEKDKDQKTPIEDKYGEVGLDPDYCPSIDADAAEKMREAIVSAAQQIERQRGSLPGYIAQVVDRICQPEISWKEVLSQFVTRCIGEKRMWCPPNRRHVWHKTYLQSRKGEKIKIGVGIDTSGSTQLEIPKFLGELNGLLNSFGNYELHLIQCDAGIEKYDYYDSSNPLNLEDQKFECMGGGGTTLHPIFDFVKDNLLEIDALIVFTDGWIEKFYAEEAPSYPVLWLLTRDGDDSQIEFGEKIKFKNSTYDE